MKVELFTASGLFIERFGILPFTIYPDVLQWGYRTFKHEKEGRYKECFNYTLPSDFVPLSIRVGDPLHIRDELGAIAFEAEVQFNAVKPKTEYALLPLKEKDKYAAISEAVIKEGMKAFSAEWKRGADGSVYLIFNQSAIK